MTPFATFWLAQAVSRFGDPITLIALASITYRTTSSALLTAMAVVAATLPSAVFGFVGGAIADALSPRRAMVVCDFARFILVGAIPFALQSHAGVFGAYACALGAGFCGAVFNPARIAIVPELVPADAILNANARITATDRTVEICGALAAGFLVALIGEGAFFVDAVTFAVSGFLLLLLPTAMLPRSRLSPRQLISDAIAGVRYLFASDILRANTVFSLVAQLASPVANGLSPVLVIRRFAAGNAEVGASLFGASEAAIAVGAVMAGVVLPEYVGRVRKGQLLVGGFAIYGLLLVLLGLAPSFLPALVIFFCIGAANVTFLVPNITISIEATPSDLRARVVGVRIALLNLTWLPLVLISGALGDVVDVGVLISAAGALTVVTALVGARFPQVRDVR
jgi:MFS family permease